MKEVDLSLLGKIFLTDQNCTELYGEVLDIDLVGINGNIIYGLELKISLNLKVLQQAKERLKYCNYVYIGVPYEKMKNYLSINDVYKLWLETHGIGLVSLIEIRENWGGKGMHASHYTIIKQAKFNRRNIYKDHLKKQLNDLSRDRDGGYASGEMFSPYKRVINEIQRIMWRMTNDKWQGKEYFTVDEILKELHLTKQHYANSRAGLYKILNAGWNKSWVERHPEKHLYKIKLKEEPKSIW